MSITHDPFSDMSAFFSLETMEPRLLLSVAMDTTFNKNVTPGYLEWAQTAGTSGAYVQATGVQSTGSIIALGNTPGAQGNNLALWRLNADGTQDTSFGTSGTASFSASNVVYATASSMSVQADDKIVVAGTLYNTDAAALGERAFLARFNADGTLDTSFGSNGWTYLSAGTYSYAYAVTVLSNGKIVTAGQISYVEGSPYGDVMVAQYTSSGTLDTSFGVNGFTLYEFGYHSGNGSYNGSDAKAIAVLSNGNILLGGEYNNGTQSDLMLIEFTSIGSRYNTFNSAGTPSYVTWGPSYNDYLTSLVVGSDGAIYAGGYSQVTDANFSAGYRNTPLVVSFTQAGALNTTFGGIPTGQTTPQGYTALSLTSSTTLNQLLLQSDGQFLLVGTAVDKSNNRSAYFTRLTAVGARDTSVGDMTFSIPSIANAATIINGKLLILGQDTDNGATGPLVAKYSTKGNTVPTLSNGTLTGATQDHYFEIPYLSLLNGTSAADGDGDKITFVIQSVTSGTLTLGGVPVTTGTVVGADDTLVWTPPAGQKGILAAFTVKTFDGLDYSATIATVSVQVGTPDLTVTAVSSDVNQSAVTGAAVNWSATIKNNSTSKQWADWTVEWYLSTDATWQATDTLITSKAYSAAIEAGNSVTENISAVVPSLAVNGQKYLIARVVNSGADGLASDDTLATTDMDWFGTVSPDVLDTSARNGTLVTSTSLGTIAGSKTISGLTLDSAADKDFYQFSTIAPIATSNYIRIDFNNAEGDLYLKIYDSSGTLLSTSDSTGNYEQVNPVATLPTGTYYVEVGSAKGDVSPAYSLSFVAPTAPDLTPTFSASMSLPASAISGNGTSFYVPINITNSGTGAVPANSLINIAIYARPSTDTSGASDTLLTTLTGMNVSYLASTASSTFGAYVTLPAGLATGNYYLVAAIDTTNKVAEANVKGDAETNNTVQSAGTIAVARGYVDLAVSLNSSGYTLPSTVVANTSFTGTVPIVIKNVGNIATPASQTIGITLVAENTVTKTQIQLASVTAYPYSLGANQSITVSPVGSLVNGLAAGTYDIHALISNLNGLADETVANNDTSNAATPPQIVSAAPFVDLVAGFGTMTLPASAISGNGTSIYVPVTVRNRGNVALPASSLIDIAIYARPSTDTSGASDTLLTTLISQNISYLAANSASTSTFSAYVTLPASLASGTYNLVAIVDSSNKITESDDPNGTNNTIVSVAGINVTHGYVDLAAGFGAMTLPASTISGNGTSFYVPVTVKNAGNISVPANSLINIAIYARPGTDATGASDTLLATLTNQNVGNLAVNAFSTFGTYVTMPAGLASGTYNLVAVIDTKNTVAESDDPNGSNNTIVSASSLTVTRGYVDLALSLNSSSYTLPTSVVTNTSFTGTAPIIIKNIGNIATSYSQAVGITLVAENTQTNVQTTLWTTTVTLYSLGANLSTTLLASITVANGLAAGTYNIHAFISNLNGLADETAANNDTSYAATAPQIVSAAPFVDLVAGFGTMTLPTSTISGNGTSIYVPVTVKNRGNVALPAGSLIDIAIYARPSTDATGASDSLLTTLTNQNVASLAANNASTITFGTAVTLPASLASGTYNLVTVVDSTNKVTESDDPNGANNTAVSTASMAVTHGYVDLAAGFGATTLPASIISGSGTSIYVPVTVKNAGNLNVPANSLISVAIYARPGTDATGASDTLLATLTGLSVSYLPANATSTFGTNITMPAGLATGTYNLVTVIDTANTVAESDDPNGTNNTIVSTSSLAVTRGYVDLALSLSSTGYTLPLNVVAGQSFTGSAPIVIKNIGNIATPSTLNIGITLVAENTQTSVKTTLGTASVTLYALGANLSTTVYPAISIPSGLASGTYNIHAYISALNGLADENSANNDTSNSATPPQIASMTAYKDLVAGFGALTLPTSTISGNGTSIYVPVTVKNRGNVALPINSLIDIAVYARPSTDATGASDTLITTLTNLNISYLAANSASTSTFGAYVTLPASLASGTYNLVAVVDSSNKVAEIDDPNGTNNTVISATSMNVAHGYVDLVAGFGTMTLPASTVSGNGTSINVPVTVKNAGNIIVPASSLINIAIYARPNTDSSGASDTLLTTLVNQNVGYLAANATSTFSAYITLPQSLASGIYNLVAVVDTTNKVVESDDPNGANNTVVSATSMNVAHGYVDLVAGFGTLTLPASTISGNGTSINVPVTVKNAGNIVVPASSLINIAIYARPNTDSSGASDTLLTTLVNQNVGYLTANSASASTFSAYVTLPQSLASGTYNLVAVIDTTNKVVESDDPNGANNTVVSATSMNVTHGYVDLAISLAATGYTLPQSVVMNTGFTGSSPIVIKNIGNISTPASQSIVITLVAENTQTNAQTTLATASTSLYSLGANLSTTIYPYINLTGGLASGTYNIHAFISALNGLVDNSAANNDTSNAATPPQIISAAPFVDLKAGFGTMTLPASTVSGNGTSTYVPVTVKNVGNVSVPASSLINIAIYARPNTDSSGASDTLLTTLLNQNVGYLAANATSTFSAYITLPQSLASGTYNLVAVVDTTNKVVESDDPNGANNTAVSSGSMNVTHGYVDLVAGFGTVTLPASTISGNGTSIYVPVTVKNAGNISVPANSLINIAIYARPNTDSSGASDTLLTTLANQYVSSLAVNATSAFGAYVTLPQSLASGTYNLVAVVDTTNKVVESDDPNGTNNTAVSSGSMNVIHGYVDLVAGFGTMTLPASTVSGNGTSIYVPVTVKNAGNIVVPANSLINIAIYARPNTDSSGASDTLLTTLVNQNVGYLTANSASASTFGAYVTLPQSLASGTYNLVAVVDTTNKVVESDDPNGANNTAVSSGSMNIIHGYVDLVAGFGTGSTLPATVSRASGAIYYVPVTVKNAGNINVSAGSYISIALYARPTSDPTGASDTLLTTLTSLNVSYMAANNATTSTFLPTVKIPATLATGAYNIVAVIDSTNSVLESDDPNGVNNTIISATTLNVTL